LFLEYPVSTKGHKGLPFPEKSSCFARCNAIEMDLANW